MFKSKKSKKLLCSSKKDRIPKKRKIKIMKKKKYKNHSNGYYDAQQYQGESVFPDHGFHM